MKLKHFLMLMSAAMSLQPVVCSGHEPKSDSFAEAATLGGENSVSTNPRDFSCRADQDLPAGVAMPQSEVDRTKVNALRTSTNRDRVNEEEELGRETYRVLLAAVAAMLFLHSRRKSGD